MSGSPAGKQFEPSVLRWSREKAGISVEILAEKLASFWQDVTPSLVSNWEKGTSAPTPVQIKKLAEIYKRPTAVFLLAKPPGENDLPPDRRTFGSTVNEVLSIQALLTIRRARRVQVLAEELGEELSTPISFKYRKHEIIEDPVTLAAKIRADLSVSITDQFRFRTYSDFFEYLRGRIESTGIITLRSGGHNSFPTEDARAFSFIDKQPYVILINNKDSDGAKMFSLVHEFGHVLIREGGICNNFSTFNKSGKRIDPFEVFCNQFASSFLVPERDFLAHKALPNKKNITREELDSITKVMAKDFKVSRFVILRKLLSLGFIGPQTYKEKAEEWEREKPPKRQGGRSNPPKDAILKNGVTFSSLVHEAYKSEKLSYASASDYLGIKAKHIPAFERFLKTYGR